jgi:hypothetical protein
MSMQTKIQLSTLEAELLNNSEWILTKNNIIKKSAATAWCCPGKYFRLHQYKCEDFSRRSHSHFTKNFKR